MRELERTLRNLGLSTEVVVVPPNGALTNLTIEEIEERARRVLHRAAQPPRRRCHHRPGQEHHSRGRRRRRRSRTKRPGDQRPLRSAERARARRTHDVLAVAKLVGDKASHLAADTHHRLAFDPQLRASGRHYR